MDGGWNLPPSHLIFSKSPAICSEEPETEETGIPIDLRPVKHEQPINKNILYCSF